MLDSVRPSVHLPGKLLFRGLISYIIKIGNPNVVCRCILGWRSVEYDFRITVIIPRF